VAKIVIFNYICSMKYLIRVLKYYIYLALVLALFIGILIALGVVGTDINEIFRDGAKSLVYIALIILAFALIYPKISFVTRTAQVPGAYDELRQGVIEVMQKKGYVLEHEAAETMIFRKSGWVSRLFRMFEDRIVIRKNFGGFELDGYNKDLVRIISALEAHFRASES